MRLRIRSAVIICFSLFYSLIRPFLGQSGICCYYLTCSGYARKKITHERFLIIAVYKTIRRLLYCSFLTKQSKNYFDE